MKGKPVSETSRLWPALGLVLVSLASILVPVVSAALLPLLTAFAAEMLLLVSGPLLARLRQLRIAKLTCEWAGWARIGLCINVWRHFPQWQGILAGVALFWILSRVLRAIERRQQLTLPRGGRQGCGKPD